MRLAVGLCLVASLIGCADPRGIKVLNLNDLNRAAWAKPKSSFESSEWLLVHIAGYGGRNITLEVLREPNIAVHRTSHTIPPRKTYRTYDGYVFIDRWRATLPARQETFYWTSTDYMLQLEPLPPGTYELRLKADDERTDSVKFTVEPATPHPANK